MAPSCGKIVCSFFVIGFPVIICGSWLLLQNIFWNIINICDRPTFASILDITNREEFISKQCEMVNANLAGVDKSDWEYKLAQNEAGHAIISWIIYFAMIAIINAICSTICVILGGNIRCIYYYLNIFGGLFEYTICKIYDLINIITSLIVTIIYVPYYNWYVVDTINLNGGLIRSISLGIVVPLMFLLLVNAMIGNIFPSRRYQFIVENIRDNDMNINVDDMHN